MARPLRLQFPGAVYHLTAHLEDESFVDWVQARWASHQTDRSISRLCEIQKPQDLGGISDAVTRLSPESKLQRKLILYAARTYTALTLREMGAYMGRMSDVTVRQAVRRPAQNCMKNLALGRFLDRLDATMGQE
jgi:hypothetical protein